MTGWCPRHDRVFEAVDGLCPKCGTALVSDDAPAAATEVIVIDGGAEQDATPEREVVAPSPKRKALFGIAAAMVVAFVAGLAFPRGDERVTTSTAPRDVVAELNVGLTRVRSDVPLRLESFTQRGRNVVARISVPESVPVGLGRLAGVHVTFALAGGGELSDNVAPRTTTSGFVIAGTFLQRGDLPVTALRIEALEFRGGDGRRSLLDLSEVWPATAKDQPRAARANIKIKPGDGRTITIDGLVGWQDRVELGLTIDGGNPGLVYDTAYSISAGTELVEGVASDESPSDEDATVTVRFSGLPADRTTFELFTGVRAIRAIGPWEWSFI